MRGTRRPISAVSVLLGLLAALLLSPLCCFSWTGLPSSSGSGSRIKNTRQPPSASTASASPPPLLQRLSALATPPSAAESTGKESGSSSSSNSNRRSYYFMSETATSTSSTSTSKSERRDIHQTTKPKSNSLIQQELASGRVLEGGQVIDFSSVKASSKAEQALAKAREELLQRNKKNFGTFGQNQDGSTSILGINEQVIKEVGHELGTFATTQEIQDCAAYLRSQAPPGLLEERKQTSSGADEAGISSSSSSSHRQSSFSPDQVSHFRTILSKAYLEAGEVTGAFAKTFYMGTMLLPPAAREAIWAVYVWCRRTDEIVDAPRDNNDDMLLDLSSWELRLENLWQYGDVVDVYDLCLLDCRIQYPTMDITPFMDMIRGMLMDVPGLGQDRYDSFDELHLYCYRVAGTVGLMSLPIFGCATGFDDETAREPALSLGVAFQLTNILRDVGEDAVQRGRVYLPQEDLATFGVTEDQIFAQRVDENYIQMMKFQIARARRYYERARRGVFMLAPESRLPVQSSLDAYGRILDKIEANGYDSLTKRAYVDKWEKLSILPSSWYRTLDISRVFPLPGDPPVVLDRV